MSDTIKKGMIGTAGEYYVCAELCRRNILALPSSKNNPLFDILASDTEGRRTVAIQVKTMGLKNEIGWKLGKDIEICHGNPNLFVVLVNMKENGTNEFYIYGHDEFANKVRERYEDHIRTPKRNGEPRKEVGFRWYDFKFFTADDYRRKNKWGLLGFPITNDSA